MIATTLYTSFVQWRKSKQALEKKIPMITVMKLKTYHSNAKKLISSEILPMAVRCDPNVRCYP